MYTNSNRHRMHKNKFPYKEGDNITYRVGDSMIATGEIVRLFENDDRILVKTGNGGLGLDYVFKSKIVEQLNG